MNFGLVENRVTTNTNQIFGVSKNNLQDHSLMRNTILRGTIVTKAPLRVQFLLAFGGEMGWERGKAEASSLALLNKKGVGREGSIENQQKSDFFCSESLPYLAV